MLDLRSMKAFALSFAILAGLIAPSVGAEPAAKGDKDAPAGEKVAEGLTPLPADVTTEQHVTLPGRTLKYHVTVGSLPMRNAKGEHKADIAYIAYTLDGGKPVQERPITFAFNGGPGAASAYLHLGALGPKRLAFGNQANFPSEAPRLVDNPDTWLDFTDLVFVDPVGTGYSATLSGNDDDNKAYWGVAQDVDSLSSFIIRFLTKTDRLASPHYLVGESYGGFRVPKILHHLQVEDGVGVSGAVLLSPALDFSLINGGSLTLLADMCRLPSLAAAALSAKGPVTLEALRPVEEYASGPYLVDLAHGKGDAAAKDRAAAKVAELTGLDPKLVRQLGAQIDFQTFARAAHRDQGRVSSIYDATVTGYDPFPDAAEPQFEDPILKGTVAPVTSAMVDYVQGQLGFKPDRPYRLLNYDANGKWDWNVSTQGGEPKPPSAVEDLRQALALDSKLRIMIAHGVTDTITPYYGSKFVIEHVPDFGDPNRLFLKVYPGGHMAYTRDDSRAALRADAMKLYPGG